MIRGEKVKLIPKDISIVIAFILYLIFMLSVGTFFYRRTQSISDYFLGGRKLNSWVTSLSAQASDMSGWLLMGLPGYAYIAGIEASWIALGLAVGTYLNWKFVAKKLRNYTQLSGNSITLPAFFENRFRDKSKVLRILSAIFILIFFLIYTASGFVAGGKLFNTVFGVPYLGALAIGVLVIILYTFLGGFLAVCWTDFFQGMLMFFAILIVPITAMQILGGPSVTFNKLAEFNSNLINPFTSTDGSPITAIALISLLAWGLGYFGQPHILTRFMAIQSSDMIKKSRVIAMFWVVLSLAGAVLVGMVGHRFLTTPLEGPATETVFMVMVNQLFPSFIAGILLSAILAAIMSTADSQLLVTASAISEDFYKTIFRKKASEKELVWVSRFTVILVAIIAFLLAMNPENSVLDLVEYAWAGFGATFGPIILLSLFWKRTTRNGAVAGIVCGGIVTIIWKQLSGGIFDLYEIVPGFVCSLIAITVVSLIDNAPAKEVVEEFEKVNSSGI